MENPNKFIFIRSNAASRYVVQYPQMNVWRKFGKLRATIFSDEIWYETFIFEVNWFADIYF